MEEQNIPIDINASKLLDWLISRRHCNKHWHNKIPIIREKINNAIQNMPIEEFGTHIHYFHVKKIIEFLKETDANTKNIFGVYGSQRMKDWMEIEKLYEKDNIYLAEAAQTLIHNINYEIPSLKKQIQKFEQTQNELLKKEEDYLKSENTAQTEFNNLCKQLGISGQKIKAELAQRLSELPEIYDEIGKKVKCLKSVYDYYFAFLKFVRDFPQECDCIPMVKYIADNGNTTVYKWIYKEEPLSIVEPPLCFTVEDEDVEKKTSDDIDFGDNEIDFGNLDALSLDDNQNDQDKIDWGAEIEFGDNVNEIDFNISLEESGIVVESSGNDGGIARGHEAYTLLDYPKTRSEFINELYEVQAFLKLRFYELKNDMSKNVISWNNIQDVDPLLQITTLENVQTMLDDVQVIISEMIDHRVQHLHCVKHCPRYVDTLTGLLKQKLRLVEKMQSLQKAVQEKREDLKKQAADLQPTLKLLISNTKELQFEIERDISKKYKNRVVRLTGGVNIL